MPRLVSQAVLSKLKNMRWELKYNRTQLIEEYAAVHNLDPLPDNKESLDAATRYLYKLLLSDLRPPWLTHAFPQTLSGNSLLSRYTRPSFCNGTWVRDSNCSVIRLLTRSPSMCTPWIWSWSAFSRDRSTFALLSAAAKARCACHSPACPSWSSKPRAARITVAGSAWKTPARGSRPLAVHPCVCFTSMPS